MLNYRSQFPDTFRQIINGNLPKASLPANIYTDFREQWDELKEEAQSLDQQARLEIDYLGHQFATGPQLQIRKRKVCGQRLWDYILKSKIPHKDLNHQLQWHLSILKDLDRDLISNLSIRCSLGDRYNDEGEETADPKAYHRIQKSIFKEDIRDPYVLHELNQRNCKIVHFVQAAYPKEYQSLVNSIRLLRYCIENPLYYKTLTKKEAFFFLRQSHLKEADIIGYRYWFFDIDAKRYHIDSLKAYLKQLNLWEYTRCIMESSSGRFHVYLQADLDETAHWDPSQPLEPEVKKGRRRFVQIWEQFQKILSADVGKILVQKASLPGYINPRTGEVSRISHRKTAGKVKKLTLERAQQIATGILGEEVRTQTLPTPRVVRADVKIPTFQQYNEFHNFGDEIINCETLNAKVMHLTRHIFKYLEYPFDSRQLDQYFERVVRPAFQPHENYTEVQIQKKYYDLVRSAEKYAESNTYRPPNFVSAAKLKEIDDFLKRYEAQIKVAQMRYGELTPKGVLKIPRAMRQFRLALLDPKADVHIKNDRLVGKIPCKYLKGPENGLGRYNEFLRALGKMGLLYRSVTYQRPHRDSNARWRGEARLWTLYLERQEPQDLDLVANHSYTDYLHWTDQNEQPPPDWVGQYEAILEAA